MIGIAVMLGIVGWLILGTGSEDATVSVIVPTLTPAAQAGAITFNRVCQDCHGDNAGGSSVGPAMVNPIYRPGHHADGAIRIAIAQGVRAHHWKFGPMPAQPDVKPEEIRPLITFIREMQRANGIN
ncbi:MAG TPA: cytochrome c [Rhodospirillales bacterium]|nr:cytochrome c [Rhodospirillales bacterium]